LLAEESADLSAADARARSPAVLAAFCGHENCLRFLAQRGVDMEVRADDGCSVAMMSLLGQGLLLQDPCAEHSCVSRCRGEAQPSSGMALRSAVGGRPLLPQQWRARCHSPLSRAGLLPLSAGEEVLDATKRGNEDRLRSLLARGAPIATRSGTGGTPMILAAREGHQGCLRLLIEHHADLEAKNTHGLTATISAARSGREGCLRLLTRAGVNLEASDNYGHTALISAARCGQERCLLLLLWLGAKVGAKRIGGQTAAIDAADNGHERCLRLLVAFGADLGCKTNDGSTALGLAARHGHEACVRCLAEHGLDLLEREGSGSRPLQLLAARTPSFVRALLPEIDWHEAAQDGLAELRRILVAAPGADGPLPLAPASLHFALWDESAEPRDAVLADALSQVVRELVRRAGRQEFEAGDKELLSKLLSLGALAADTAGRPATEAVVDEALDALEVACDRRQQDLGPVAGCTPEIDTVYPHSTRLGTEECSPLDQRDALPREAWAWLDTGQANCFDALCAAYKGFQHVGAVHDQPGFAHFLREHQLASDEDLFAAGAADLLAAYATLVNPCFVDFMQNHFGARFTAAPIKRKPRMLEKVAQDLQEEWPEFPGFESPEAVASERARCGFFALGDVVRGSVAADGAEAMLATKEKLHSLAPSEPGYTGFEVWRVKNTHHHDSTETLGGYRDMKVLGLFSAPAPEGSGLQPLSMIVEVQVIDTAFLSIKKSMHKVYAIRRGDFWEH